jgi:hypothetical protein
MTQRRRAPAVQYAYNTAPVAAAQPAVQVQRGVKRAHSVAPSYAAAKRKKISPAQEKKKKNKLLRAKNAVAAAAIGSTGDHYREMYRRLGVSPFLQKKTRILAGKALREAGKLLNMWVEKASHLDPDVINDADSVENVQFQEAFQLRLRRSENSSAPVISMGAADISAWREILTTLNDIRITQKLLQLIRKEIPAKTLTTEEGASGSEESEPDLQAQLGVHIMEILPGDSEEDEADSAMLGTDEDDTERRSRMFERIVSVLERGGQSRVKAIYEIIHKSDKTLRFPRTEKRMLLWHGTSTAVVGSILLNGLRLPQVSTHGANAGKGIYLASDPQKALQYASDPTNGTKAPDLVLLLVDTVVGREQDITAVDVNITGPASGFDSVLVRGTTEMSDLATPTLVRYNSKWGGLCIGSAQPSGITSDFGMNEHVVYKPERGRTAYCVSLSR